MIRDVLSAAGRATAGLRVMPDYLMVGGKRCGSTSVQKYLAEHPGVLPPHSGKGTHYFDENYAKGPAWFQAHYPTKAAMKARSLVLRQPVITGEASPYYSYHPAAFARIHDLLPQVKLVMVVRDPVERAYSHWRYEQRRGFEALEVHDALDAEEGRLAGEEEKLLADPGYVSWNHRHFSYVARSRYADQLQRCLTLFDRAQVHVVDFDDVVTPGSTALADLGEFLGLAPTGHALPRLESGGTDSSVPADVRERLAPVFADSNAWMKEEFGIDLG